MPSSLTMAARSSSSECSSGSLTSVRRNMILDSALLFVARHFEPFASIALQTEPQGSRVRFRVVQVGEQDPPLPDFTRGWSSASTLSRVRRGCATNEFGLAIKFAIDRESGVEG